jgi:hypothetical protein
MAAAARAARERPRRRGANFMEAILRAVTGSTGPILLALIRRTLWLPEG